MDKVWCVFYNYDDGYECSSQTLIGIFLTEDDAEKALTKYCELSKEYNEVILPRKHYAIQNIERQHKKYSREWFEAERKINADVDLWCVEQGVSQNTLCLRSNIDCYEISEFPLEEIVY